jgi:hypothetical protein
VYLVRLSLLCHRAETFLATTVPLWRHNKKVQAPVGASFKYNIRWIVRPYLSQALVGDILVFRDHGFYFRCCCNNECCFGCGHWIRGEEKEQEITKAEVVNHLKAIETMMHPLVPLKDQLIAIETTLVEQGQQQQLLSMGLLHVEWNQGPGCSPPNGRRHPGDDEEDDDRFPSTHKIEFPKYDTVMLARDYEQCKTALAPPPPPPPSRSATRSFTNRLGNTSPPQTQSGSTASASSLAKLTPTVKRLSPAEIAQHPKDGQ